MQIYTNSIHSGTVFASLEYPLESASWSDFQAQGKLWLPKEIPITTIRKGG